MWVCTTLQIYYRPDKCLVLKNTKKNTTQEGNKDKSHTHQHYHITVESVNTTYTVHQDKQVNQTTAHKQWQTHCGLLAAGDSTMLSAQTEQPTTGSHTKSCTAESTTTLLYFKQLCTWQQQNRSIMKHKTCSSEKTPVHRLNRRLLQVNLISKLYSSNAFSALTLLVGRQEGHLACKNGDGGGGQ